MSLEERCLQQIPTGGAVLDRDVCGVSEDSCGASSPISLHECHSGYRTSPTTEAGEVRSNWKHLTATKPMLAVPHLSTPQGQFTPLLEEQGSLLQLTEYHQGKDSTPE